MIYRLKKSLSYCQQRLEKANSNIWKTFWTKRTQDYKNLLNYARCEHSERRARYLNRLNKEIVLIWGKYLNKPKWRS